MPDGSSPDVWETLYQKTLEQSGKIAKLSPDKQEFIYGRIFDGYVVPKTGISGDKATKLRQQFIDLHTTGKYRTFREPGAAVTPASLVPSMVAEAGAGVSKGMENIANTAIAATGGEYLRQKLAPESQKLGTQLFGGPAKKVEESEEIQAARKKHPIAMEGADIVGRSIPSAMLGSAVGPTAGIVGRAAKQAVEAVPFTDKPGDLPKVAGSFIVGGEALRGAGKALGIVKGAIASGMAQRAIGRPVDEEAAHRAAEALYNEGVTSPTTEQIRTRAEEMAQAPEDRLAELDRKIGEKAEQVKNLQDELERMKLEPKEAIYLKEKQPGVMTLAKDAKRTGDVLGVSKMRTTKSPSQTIKLGDWREEFRQRLKKKASGN